MTHRRLRAVAIALIVFLSAACGSGSTTASPSPSALTFDSYAAAFCSAWDTMFQAVGNPDTGSGSVLSKSLDDAVAAGDVATAERVGATITTSLELARQQAALAGRWPTAGPMMAEMDRFLVAYEAMIAAKRAAAAHAQGADPQAAFERAGGVTAWTAMFAAYPGIARPSGSSPQACPTVPIAP